MMLRPRVLIAALAVPLLAAALLATPGMSDDASNPVKPQPVLSVAGLSSELIAAVSGGEPGEVWAHQVLPFAVAQPKTTGARADLGDDPGSEVNPFAFLRHTDADGWQVYETPLDAGGLVLRAFRPVGGSGVMTARGGGAILGVSGSREVLLKREPAGRFRELPIDSGILTAGEKLAPASNRPPGRIGVWEQGGATQVLIATASDVADGVLYWDGIEWKREDVEIPAGSESDFEIVALDAAGAGDAWLLARTAGSLGDGVRLFERVADGSAHTWRLRPLGDSRFERASDAALELDGVGVLAQGRTDPLTVTADGVWIDGGLRHGATPGDPDDPGFAAHFTIYFDQSAQRLTGTWCDVPLPVGSLCDGQLPTAFSTGVGYQSIAWPGSGHGTRIVSNPIDAAGSDASNRGTYLKFSDERFTRMPGAGGNENRSAAFSSADAGWLEGLTEITGRAKPDRLAGWPLTVRTPLYAVTPEPGKPPAAESSGALAVGAAGAVARYVPGDGWNTEFLLTASGLVTKPNLRGVAWPTASRAHAVGDVGAIWLWRAETGLWERDPGTPPGLDDNLMDVAFAPGNDARGFAIGRRGVILRYDKSWEPEPLVSGCLPPSVADNDFYKIAFAGNQALVAAGDALLINDGGDWCVDSGAAALLARHPGVKLIAVAGLPDGGAIAAGTQGFLLKRESAGAPWTTGNQPLLESTIASIAAFRQGGALRTLASAVPLLEYPSFEAIPPVDPSTPLPLFPQVPAPGDGFLMRETANGWHDEQRMAFGSGALDKAVKADAVYGMLVDGSGEGWAVGGWNGRVDSAGRGSDDSAQRQRVQTARIMRYTQSPPQRPAGTSAGEIELKPGAVNFVVGAHAQCEERCAELAARDLAPDKALTAALAQTAKLAKRDGGPRFFMYAGGRNKPVAGNPQAQTEADRFAELLYGEPDLPVYAAMSAGDSVAGSTSAFKRSFAGAPAPFGDGSAPPGVDPLTAGSGTKTHYAFESQGTGGRLRVIVIDNSRGRLSDSDAHQNPPEPQLDWLRDQLADARADAVPAIVVGSRDLNDRISPRLNPAFDGQAVAKVLKDGGASAYFFERPEENRYYTVPAGDVNGVPAFGTGTLGYRSDISIVTPDRPSSLFGQSGYLLASVDVAARNPATNVAPVAARLIPLVEELSIEAVDGTLLRRSRASLFRGIGRRPTAGDRWGASSSGLAEPAGSDPYSQFPADLCLVAGCTTRLEPEYQFSSSDPDIGDFVQQDPNSTNLRKPLLSAEKKAVSDSSSGLFCAFNAGTTLITLRAGGMSYSRRVTVQAGTAQPPCGTRPLNPGRFVSRSPAAATPPPPAPPPTAPPVSLSLPPAPAPPAVPPPVPAVLVPSFFAPLQPAAPPRAVAAPPPPSLARPIPPTGGMSRVFEEKREEEAATEDSQAFARFDANEGPPIVISALGLALIAGLAGASLAVNRNSNDNRRPASVTATIAPDRRRRNR